MLTILTVGTVLQGHTYVQHIRLSTFNMCSGFMSVTSQYKCLNSEGKVIRSQILKCSKEAKGPDVLFQQTQSKISSSAHCMTNSEKSPYWNTSRLHYVLKKCDTYVLKISIRKELWPICNMKVSFTPYSHKNVYRFLTWHEKGASTAPNNGSPTENPERQSIPKVGHQISGWH